MTKQEKQSWAVTAYQNGEKVSAICEALDITAPTFYRWIKQTNFEPRRPDRIADGLPDIHRSEACKQMWRKRYADRKELGTRDKLKKSKQLSLLEVLKKLNLSLSLDNQGHCLIRPNQDNKLYITDAEFKALTTRPIETLRTFVQRINATFGGDK